MAATTMTQMWALLDAYTLNQAGAERAVNNLNEWGGFSRRLGMPVFTGWKDYMTFDRETKMTKCEVCDSTWDRPIGVANQERWLKVAEESESGLAAFFVIHAADENAVDGRTVKYIDDDRVFIGKVVREGTKTYVVGQPKLL